MKLINKSCRSGLRAALSLALALASGAACASDVATLVGGDTISGDQATVSLDPAVPNAFSYLRQVSGTATATAYFNFHLFCAETPRSTTLVSLLPRYQLPASIGGDVWKFPDVYAHSLVYQGSGALNAGAPVLRIGEANSLGHKQFRCLSSIPGSSAEPWHVSQGLFDSGYGDYLAASFLAPNTSPPRDPPSAPHQNAKVVAAHNFPGFPGMAVSIVRVEMEFDVSNPATTEWTLVDGYNASALSPSVDATWCRLGTTWIDGSPPPVGLCDDPGLGAVVKETGPFVRLPINFVSGATPYYVLAYRPVVGVAASGTPTQGFAVLRTGGGLSAAAEELQDWFADDSVWYNY